MGPTWQLGPYFLGADSQGRDVAARLLYGGRNSLLIGGSRDADLPRRSRPWSASSPATSAGWSTWCWPACSTCSGPFPVYLLAISLSIVLIAQGLTIGPITITSGSLWLPIVIIGIVYVPYVARPIRGQVIALKRSEFVLAAIGLGVPSHRILLRDILPNIATSLIVFCPLMLA